MIKKVTLCQCLVYVLFTVVGLCFVGCVVCVDCVFCNCLFFSRPQSPLFLLTGRGVMGLDGYVVVV